MIDTLARDECAGVAALVHQSGPSQRVVSWLGGDAATVTVSPSGLIHVSDPDEPPPGGDVMAKLERTGDSFKIIVSPGQHVWVNGELVDSCDLCHGDMIEFGEIGPLSRFRLYPGDKPGRKPVGEILGDGIAYMRSSRQPIVRRTGRWVKRTLHQLVSESSTAFRITILLAFVGLGALIYQQRQLNQMLIQELARESTRLDSFSKTLTRARDEALTVKDLKALRDEIGSRLTTASSRLAALEKRSEAAARVVQDAQGSVFLLQGGYGFRHTPTGQFLRQVLDESGNPLLNPLGQPLLSLGDAGPIAEKQFTGTGFAVDPAGVMVTNRHVANPWEEDTVVDVLAAQQMEPVITKFVAYQPGQTKPIPVTLIAASDAADLALLRYTPAGPGPKNLPLATEPPAAGSEVILMGYPTGLRALVAQSGRKFIAELEESKDTEFWSVAAKLAARGAVVPLASRGIVAKVTNATVVYDAETTSGGSGGPVLDSAGRVVAVNFGILPEFGGSNLGVPVKAVQALLQKAGLR